VTFPVNPDPDFSRWICLIMEVPPSLIGLNDPVGESMVSLGIQRHHVERIDRRAPGDWAAEAAKAEDALRVSPVEPK